MGFSWFFVKYYVHNVAFKSIKIKIVANCQPTWACAVQRNTELNIIVDSVHEITLQLTNPMYKSNYKQSADSDDYVKLVLKAHVHT